MTIIEKISTYIKRKNFYFSFVGSKSTQFQKLNPLIIISLLIVFSCLFFISINLVNEKNKKNANNFKEITETNEFLDLTSFLMSKINSPYKEINYVIRNNDSIEKILKKFNVNDKDIKNISVSLKQKNLTSLHYKN